MKIVLYAFNISFVHSTIYILSRYIVIELFIEPVMVSLGWFSCTFPAWMDFYLVISKFIYSLVFITYITLVILLETELDFKFYDGLCYS